MDSARLAAPSSTSITTRARNYSPSFSTGGGITCRGLLDSLHWGVSFNLPHGHEEWAGLGTVDREVDVELHQFHCGCPTGRQLSHQLDGVDGEGDFGFFIRTACQSYRLCFGQRCSDYQRSPSCFQPQLGSGQGSRGANVSVASHPCQLHLIVG
jgi:hypothetical protein